jgi:aryl-alcohol dehydrogenase-like predicted oxidoreductase
LYGAGQIEQVGAFSLVELEGGGDTVEDGVGGAGEVAAFHADVVVDAHAGQQRDLFAAQPFDAMFGVLADQGVASIPWSPLAKGRLARPWGEQTARSSTDDTARWVLPHDDKPIADAVQSIAADRGVPMAQVALAWVVRNPVVAAPIVGATRPHHLADAIGAPDITLTDDEAARLEQHYTPREPTGY